MNKIKLKRKTTQADLTAALDRSVEAAFALGVSEADLVAQLLKRLQRRAAASNVVPLRADLPRRMYNPDAGP